MNGMTLQIVLLIGALGIMWVMKGRRLWADWKLFQQWRQGAFEPVASPMVPPQPPAVPFTADLTILPGAGQALANPPTGIKHSLAEIRRYKPQAKYAIPLGWYHDGAKATPVYATFVDDVNHILVTGQSDVGKDNTVLSMLFSLATTYTPQQLQIAIVDGKSGLSWNGWHTKLHTWLFARTSKDIPTAMETLTKERERREQLLWDAGVEKWEQYTGGDLPLLVVYISELLLLQAATSKSELAKWMSEELSSARSSGIRYIVATQNVTKFDTLWRSNISLFCAGYQTLPDADEPNTGLTTKALRELGRRSDGTVLAIPPSELPAPSKTALFGGGVGVFTCVQGRHVFTVRSSYLSDVERKTMLAALPDRPTARVPETVDPLLAALMSGQPLPIEDAPDEPPRSVKPTRIEDLIKQASFNELEREPLFVRSVIDSYREVKSVRQTVVAIFGSYTGSRDQLVTRVLRASGEVPERAATPAVSAA